MTRFQNWCTWFKDNFFFLVKMFCRGEELERVCWVGVTALLRATRGKCDIRHGPINTAHTKQHQHRANWLRATRLTGIRKTSDSSSWFELDFRRFFISSHLIVKVNLSLSLLSTGPWRRMGEWMYRSTLLTSELFGGDLHHGRFIRGETVPDTHWVGYVKNRKILSLPWLGLRPLDHPAISSSLATPIRIWNPLLSVPMLIDGINCRISGPGFPLEGLNISLACYLLRTHISHLHLHQAPCKVREYTTHHWGTWESWLHAEVSDPNGGRSIFCLMLPLGHLGKYTVSCFCVH
jgi:hypothetical protein